jgi:hypothetical protein
MLLSRVMVGGVLLMLWGLSRAEAQDQRTALLTADRLAATLSSDSGFPVALRRALHPTGVLLWPEAPVLLGAAEVREFLNSLPEVESLRLTWQPLGVELAGDSTLGVTWGVTVADSGVASPPGLGRYISTWRRDGGTWTIAALVMIGVGRRSDAVMARGLPLIRDAARPSGRAAAFIAADLAFARLAADSGAATAFRTWATGDAVIFGRGGLLIRGPEAIGRAVSGPGRWAWHPVAAGAAQSGDLGWTAGEAIISNDKAEPSFSKYLTVWARRGGITRFLLDGGNARPPAR